VLVNDLDVDRGSGDVPKLVAEFMSGDASRECILEAGRRTSWVAGCGGGFGGSLFG
jgi:hypothetical protein